MRYGDYRIGRVGSAVATGDVGSRPVLGRSSNLGKARHRQPMSPIAMGTTEYFIYVYSIRPCQVWV